MAFVIVEAAETYDENQTSTGKSHRSNPRAMARYLCSAKGLTTCWCSRRRNQKLTGC